MDFGSMKLAYSTWGMPTVPADVSIPYLAQLGFDGIELTVIPGYTTDLSILTSRQRQQIQQLLHQHQLTLSAVSAHTSLMDPEPKLHLANMERLKAAIYLAVELQTGSSRPVVNTTPGGRPDQWSVDKQQLVDRLGELIDYATEFQVIIALEPHIGVMIETPQQICELIETVNSPYLRANFDISHFEILGLPMSETIPLMVPKTAHTHVKDQRGLHPNFEFLIPGEGDFDYVAYLQTMSEYGYQGFITVEVSMMVQRRTDYDPLLAATQSYYTLSQAFDTANIQR